MIYTVVRQSFRLFIPLSGFLTMALLLTSRLQAEDISSGLSVAGSGFAPMDVSKAQDPLVPISKSQRDEMLQQFKGLVQMGISAQAYSRWDGHSMSDCESPNRDHDAWCQKCQIDMPDASGVYYFYPGSKGGACTLQQVDVHMKSPDEALLKDFREPLQELLGRGSQLETAGRHWDTGQDLADLYVEKHDDSGEPYVRFVWSRSPLIWNNQSAMIHNSAYVRAR